MRDFFILIILGFIQFGLSYAATCKNWSEGGNIECENGCCGDYGSHYCCFHWKVYAIVGGVIGGLVILGGIAFLIFFLFYYKNEQKKRQIQPSGGQVLQTYPVPYAQTTASNAGNQVNQPTAPNLAGSQPYPTGSQMAPPPPPKYSPPENNTYGLQDPAYPPQR